MGRHLQEVVSALRDDGENVCYFATSTDPAVSGGIAVPLRWMPRLIRYTPLRFVRGIHSLLGNAEFDRNVARRLPQGDRLFAFQGSALTSFRRARQLGYEELHLEAASAHVDHLRRRFDEAYRSYPLERDWLGRRLQARTKLEYEAADVIWVNSEYSRETFLAAGIAPSKIRRRRLTAAPQYRPATRRPSTELNIVYVGGLTVCKGVPLLIEAFSAIKDPSIRLTLVGGGSSRGMRNYLASALSRDSRIRLAPGAPLPILQNADLCVHPSYSDGFSYGPAEALACGVPVVATEDTGMKELITSTVNGWIVPTGSATALADLLCDITGDRSKLSTMREAMRETIDLRRPQQTDATTHLSSQPRTADL